MRAAVGGSVVLCGLGLAAPAAEAAGEADGVAATASPFARSAAADLLSERPRRAFLPMPLSRPMVVPQQEAPGIVVAPVPEPGAPAAGSAAIPRQTPPDGAAAFPTAVLGGQEPQGSAEDSELAADRDDPAERGINPFAFLEAQAEADEAGANTDTDEDDAPAQAEPAADDDSEGANPARALLGVDDTPEAEIPENMRVAAGRTREPVRLAHYAFGAYQRGLYQTAFNVALRAAANDDAAGAALIGRLYEEALGVDFDLERAVSWYSLAADLGDPQAQNRLGAMLLNGQGLPKDEERAAETFAAAADAGSADAAYNLALLTIKTGEPPAATFRLMRTAAQAGHPGAQAALATFYAEGTGTVPDDARATYWYGRAAENGDPAAALAYGLRLIAGLGAEPDAARAAPYIGLAARAGNPTAMNRYAKMLAEGIALETDMVEAVKWHLLARAGGVSDFYLDGLLGAAPQAVVDEGRRRAAAFARGR